jgi:hypothetical protein
MSLPADHAIIVDIKPEAVEQLRTSWLTNAALIKLIV